MSPIGFTGFVDADFDGGAPSRWRRRLGAELVRVLDRQLEMPLGWRVQAPRGRGGLYLDRGYHDDAQPGFRIGLDSQELWLRLCICRTSRNESAAWELFRAELTSTGSETDRYLRASLRQGFYVECYGTGTRPLVVIGPGASSRALHTALATFPTTGELHVHITRRWPRAAAVVRGALALGDIVAAILWLLPLHARLWTGEAEAPRPRRRGSRVGAQS